MKYILTSGTRRIGQILDLPKGTQIHIVGNDSYDVNMIFLTPLEENDGGNDL